MLLQLPFQQWDPYAPSPWGPQPQPWPPQPWQPQPPFWSQPQPWQFQADPGADFGSLLFLFIVIALIHTAIKKGRQKKARLQQSREALRTAGLPHPAPTPSLSLAGFVGRVLVDLTVAIVAGVVLKGLGGS